MRMEVGRMRKREECIEALKDVPCKIILLNGDATETVVGEVPRENVKEVFELLADVPKLSMVCKWCSEFPYINRRATHRSGTMAWRQHADFALAIIVPSKEKLQEIMKYEGVRRWIDIEEVESEAEETVEADEEHDEIEGEGKIAGGDDVEEADLPGFDGAEDVFEL